jgi:hypothetical protein
MAHFPAPHPLAHFLDTPVAGPSATLCTWTLSLHGRCSRVPSMSPSYHTYNHQKSPPHPHPSQTANSSRARPLCVLLTHTSAASNSMPDTKVVSRAWLKGHRQTDQQTYIHTVLSFRLWQHNCDFDRKHRLGLCYPVHVRGKCSLLLNTFLC